MTIEELRNTKRAEILRLAARRGVGNLSVFGSVARGESDADSELVDLEPGRSLFDLGGLQRDLEELLASRINVVSSRGLRDRVRENVLRDSIPL